MSVAVTHGRTAPRVAARRAPPPKKHGETPPPAPPRPPHTTDIRAAAAVAYLALIALFSLGLAAAVRDSAAATGLVLGVLYLFPLAAAVVPNPALDRHLDQIGPLPAGLDAQATTAINRLPLTPWQGLGVVALWTAGALLLGALSLKTRDAWPLYGVAAGTSLLAWEVADPPRR